MFLKKPDAKLEKGSRAFRAIGLFSVFSMWYTTVLVDLLHEEKGADCVEELASGRRERSQLRAHAGLADEYTAETLGVAGGPPDRFAARVSKIQHGLHGEHGRETSVRRGQAPSGVEGSHLNRSPQKRGGSSAGRDAVCSRLGPLRK